MRGRWRVEVRAVALLIAGAACGSQTTVPDGGADATAGTDATAATDATAGTDATASDGSDVATAADATASPPDGASNDTRLDRVARPDSLPFDGVIDGQQTACNTLENTAPTIAPVLRGFATPAPELHGGQIADGRYELVAVDELTDALMRATVPSYYRRTIEFRGGGAEWQLVEVARNNVAETSWSVARRGYSVTTSANMLTATFLACADPGGGAAGQYRYEATSDEVVMHLVSARLLFTYLRVP